MSLTGRGIGVLVGGLVLLVTAGWFGYPEVAAVGACGVLAVVVSLGAGLVRPHLEVTRVADPRRVMRGEACQVTVTVRHPRGFGVRGVVGADRCGDRWLPIPLVRLRPGHATTVSYPVPTRRRGLVRLGPLRVGRHDPLGLTRIQRSFGDTDQVWVHPYLHPIRAVPAGLSRSVEGLAEKVPHGSITFDALREYVPGDDLRHVHWRTSARIGELMVRERLDTSRPRLVVLLDDRRAVHHDETFEHACEAAASVVTAALREDLTAVLLTTGGTELTVTPGAGAYLDLLAEADTWSAPRPDRSLADRGLAGFAGRARNRAPGDTLVVLTGRVPAGDLAALARLRASYGVLVVAAFGPQSAPLDRTGVLVLPARDGADFARLWDPAVAGAR